MKKVLDPQKAEAGSKKSKEPRLLGSIVEEMLHGNSPLASAIRTCSRASTSPSLAGTTARSDRTSNR